METFLTIIGLTACIILVALAGMKLIDAVFFFKEFHEKLTKTLARIEDRLRNLKP